MRFSLLPCAAAVLMLASWTAPVAARDFNVNRAMHGMARNHGCFSSPRAQHIAALNARMDAAESPLRIPMSEQPKPDCTMGPVRGFYDLDGPDGQLWYCTYELVCSEIEHELYSEYILQEYTFNFFDENFEPVGSVHDIMRYEDDEVRVPGPDEGIGVLPIVTRNYFNSDALCEVVISLAVNTTTPGHNRYRSVVYSLGGEKETVQVVREGKELELEVDKPAMQLDRFVADVLNASTKDEERVYMTFMTEYGSFIDVDFDKLFEGDEEEGRKYWQSISQNGYTFTCYGPANAEGEFPKLFEAPVTYQCIQGDQENTPLLLTFARDGEAYILFPRYKETFFEPYYSPYEEMYMREHNTLLVDLYRIKGDGSELVATTEIPVEKVQGDGVLATYFSVGDLRYSNDVQFDANGKPEYLVTRSNYTTTGDETSGFCYYRYDSEGSQLAVLFENAQSTLELTDVPGANPQALFVSFDDRLGYVYNFVDLVEGDSDATVRIPYLVETGYDGPAVLGFNADRVPLGETWKYAFEVRTPYVDEDDNTFMRIAWFNADGSLDRIDNVDMGKRVNYATAYISGQVLQPDFVRADAANEYMVLIKRALSDDETDAQEELIIAQPTRPDLTGGWNQLYLKPCEKGYLASIGVYPATSDDTWRLLIGYSGSRGFTADFYNLPFALTSIADLEASGEQSPIAFDGSCLTAPGLEIRVYEANGRFVGSGMGTFATEELPAGLYVATAGSSAGKFIVK